MKKTTKRNVEGAIAFIQWSPDDIYAIGLIDSLTVAQLSTLIDIATKMKQSKLKETH